MHHVMHICVSRTSLHGTDAEVSKAVAPLKSILSYTANPIMQSLLIESFTSEENLGMAF